MTSINPNQSILDQQFLDSGIHVAGLKLQPLSAGILTACRKLGISLLAGTDDEKKNLTEQDKQDQLMTLVYLLAVTRDEVKKFCGSTPEARKELVDSFSFLLPLNAIPQLTEAIQELVKQANIATVDVQPKPQPKDVDPDLVPPPNS